MKLWNRIRHWTRRREFEQDLAEEMRHHRAMAEEQAQRLGATPEEARRQAGVAFGGAALALEESREQWRIRWLAEFAQDVRFALRGFRKAPGFTFAVVGTLAVGLGMLATAFNVFNAAVLRSYGVRDAQSLYAPEWPGANGYPHQFNYHSIQDMRRQKTIFEDVVGQAGSSNEVFDGAVVGVTYVTGNYFTALGAPVCMGRPILESDDTSGAVTPMVLSDRYWKRKFHADANVLGKRLKNNSGEFEIVGVACPSFEGMHSSETSAWAGFPDIRFGGRERRLSPKGSGNLQAIGRLRSDITPFGAQQALLRYGREAYSLWRDKEPPKSVKLRPCRAMVNWSDALATFSVTFIAFGLVLLIACANASNMLLARALARQREIGVRLSLGAGRARLVRQMLTESLLLALASAPAAFAVACLAGAALSRIHSGVYGGWQLSNQRWLDAPPDLTVFAFLLLAAILTTVIFGLAPALQATRANLTQAVRGEFANDHRPARLRNALAVAQIAVCALLLICTSVLLRSERIKFERAGANRWDGIYSVFTTKDYRRPNLDAALATLPQAAPAAVVTTTTIPVPSFPSAHAVGDVDLPNVWFDHVSPEFFPLRRIQFTRGRCFRRDAENEAVVSESAARGLWPHSDAIGRTVRLPEGMGKWKDDRAVYEAMVVGIVPDDVMDFADTKSSPALLYFPKLMSSESATYLIRPAGTPAEVRRAMMALQDELDMSAGTERAPVGERLQTLLAPYRALLGVLAGLGALALLLTLSGIYSVISYLVNQRAKEFGIRAALGARAADVAGLVLRQSLRLAAIGLPAGALAASYMVQWLGNKERITVVIDTVGFGGGALLVVVIALAASAGPALRAAKADPASTLRCD
jgi:predicted permease